MVVRCVDNFMVGVWDYVGGELKAKRCRLKGDVSQKSVISNYDIFFSLNKRKLYLVSYKYDSSNSRLIVLSELYGV